MDSSKTPTYPVFLLNKILGGVLIVCLIESLVIGTEPVMIRNYSISGKVSALGEVYGGILIKD